MGAPKENRYSGSQKGWKAPSECWLAGRESAPSRKQLWGHQSGNDGHKWKNSVSWGMEKTQQARTGGQAEAA